MPESAERRPSPDALLQQAKAEARGKLKIYLGAAQAPAGPLTAEITGLAVAALARLGFPPL